MTPITNITRAPLATILATQCGPSPSSWRSTQGVGTTPLNTIFRPSSASLEFVLGLAFGVDGCRGSRQDRDQLV